MAETNNPDSNDDDMIDKLRRKPRSVPREDETHFREGPRFRDHVKVGDIVVDVQPLQIGWEDDMAQGKIVLRVNGGNEEIGIEGHRTNVAKEVVQIIEAALEQNDIAVLNQSDGTGKSNKGDEDVRKKVTSTRTFGGDQLNDETFGIKGRDKYPGDEPVCDSEKMAEVAETALHVIDKYVRAHGGERPHDAMEHGLHDLHVLLTQRNMNITELRDQPVIEVPPEVAVTSEAVSNKDTPDLASSLHTAFAGTVGQVKALAGQSDKIATALANDVAPHLDSAGEFPEDKVGAAVSKALATHKVTGPVADYLQGSLIDAAKETFEAQGKGQELG